MICIRDDFSENYIHIGNFYIEIIYYKTKFISFKIEYLNNLGWKYWSREPNYDGNPDPRQRLFLNRFRLSGWNQLDYIKLKDK